MPGTSLQLVVEKGARAGTAIPLPATGTLRMGRAPECELRFDVPGVSRVHAVLDATANGARISDQGSLNGLFVNGDRVDERDLQSGDRIALGTAVVLTLQTAPEDPWLGKTCGDYRIDTFIGKGGMGRVYRATQRSLERTVALKILSRELSGRRDLVDGFIREARAAAKLSHPHVVKIHDVKEENGACFIAMEYLERGTLGSLIESKGRLPPPVVVAMLVDAAKALVWAEEHGVVHRDIKPGNLLLDARRRVKVADFGIATELRGMASDSEPRAAGSPNFMAPEQAGGAPVDHRADIYALGATAYMALSGVPPFRGSDARAIIRRKQNEDPTPLDDVVPDLPAGLSAVVQKMMARSPDERYQSAREVVGALGTLLRRLLKKPGPTAAATRGARQSGPRGAARSRKATGARVAGARADEAAPRTRERSPHGDLDRPGRRRPNRGLVLALAAGGLIVALGGWVLVRDGEERSPSNRDPATPLEERSVGDGRRPVVSSGTSTVTIGTDRSAPSARDTDSREATRTSSSTSSASGSAAASEQLAELRGAVELALLESRFERASALLEDARGLDDPDGLGAKLERRVAAAERLFEARRQALELERRGDLGGALRLLSALRGSLLEPYDAELDAALQAIRARADSGADKP